MVKIHAPITVPMTGVCLPLGLRARPVALELNKHHAEQV
jgi:hypothetical protein